MKPSKRHKTAVCEFTGIICPENWRTTVSGKRITAEPKPEAFDALRCLVEGLDPYCFWPFEVCYSRAEELMILDWLTLHNFWSETGANAGNLQFFASKDEARTLLYYQRLAAAKACFVFSRDRNFLENLPKGLHYGILITPHEKEWAVFAGPENADIGIGRRFFAPSLTRRMIERLIA